MEKGFSIGKSRKKGRSQNISQEDLAHAMAAFQANGGFIRQLPAQIVVRRSGVGMSQENAFEPVVEPV